MGGRFGLGMGGRLHVGMVAAFASEWVAGFARNPQHGVIGCGCLSVIVSPISISCLSTPSDAEAPCLPLEEVAFATTRGHRPSQTLFTQIYRVDEHKREA